MKNITHRITSLLRGNRIGLIALVTLTLLTSVTLVLSKSITPPDGPKPVLFKPPATNGVTLTGKLSQTKLVQHGLQTLYLDVTMSAPEVKAAAATAAGATDIIVVLDRSGSMGEANKLPFAKAAIREIVARLNASDRFALVSFDNQAVVNAPLQSVSDDQRDRVNQMIEAIGPGGGTNLGDGLLKARELLNTTTANRGRKVILLSDGQANQGITAPDQLAAIARQITTHEAVLSTIGMGLGFNETLMASLADHGMGGYGYLEHLDGLDKILIQQLRESRNVYASASRLLIDLGEGVRLVDAGGYPVNDDGGARRSITTGQLLGGQQKRFVITLTVPVDQLASYSVAELALEYQHDGVARNAAFSGEPLKVAVVAPERRQEATASIDEAVYQKSWVENNFGRMKKALSQSLRAGDKAKAEKVIKEYRQSVNEAQAAAPSVAIKSEELERELDDMEAKVGESFSGGRDEQLVKQNRAAKKMQLEGIVKQRK